MSRKDSLWITDARMIALAFVSIASLVLQGTIFSGLRFIRLGRFLLSLRKIQSGVTLDQKGKRRRKEVEALLSYMSIVITIILFLLIFGGVLGNSFPPYGSYFVKILISVAIVTVAMLITSVFNIFVSSKIDDFKNRLTVQRFLQIALLGVAAIAIVSFIFEQVLILATTLGVAGLVLSFSLSPIISNFISWIFISLRKPFTLGDRVVIGSVTGIVQEIGYLTTTMIEVGGSPVGSTVTGGVITFPNSLILSAAVSSYAQNKSPLTKGSFALSVSYDSDLLLVKEIIMKTVRDYLRKMSEALTQGAESNKDVVEKLVRSDPEVVFSISPTWVEVKVSYPILSGKSGIAESDLIGAILAEFKANSGSIKFPQAASTPAN